MGTRRIGTAAFLIGAITAGGAVGCMLASDDTDDSSADVTEGPAGAKGLDSAVFLSEGNCTATKVGPKHLLLAARCVSGNTAFAEGKVLKYQKAAARTKSFGLSIDTSAMSTGQKAFTTQLYPLVNPTCSGCHRTGSGGAPIYFGADATSSYPMFKARGFQLPTSIYRTKGKHEGPAMTDDQRQAADAWINAEAFDLAADAGPTIVPPKTDPEAGDDDDDDDDLVADAGTPTPVVTDGGALPPVVADGGALPAGQARITKIAIHSTFTTTCTDATTCAFGAVAAAAAEDIAVIVVESQAELTGIPTIPVDLDAVGEGDPVLAPASGCKTFDGTTGTLAAVQTVAVPAKAAGHDGSAFKGDTASLTKLGTDYVVTAGAGWKDGEAKLCKADIGAPLLRADSPVVVGVASSFTTFKPTTLVPVTIEHTRVDKESTVGPWLASLGVMTTKSCSSGTCTKHGFDGGLPIAPSGTPSNNGATTSTGTTTGTTPGTTTPTDAGADTGPATPSPTATSTSPSDPSASSPPAAESPVGEEPTGGDDGDTDAGDSDAGTKKKKKAASGCSAAPGETSGTGGTAVTGFGLALALVFGRRKRAKKA